MDEIYDGERPEIIDNLVEHLTGIKYEPVKQSIREGEEFKAPTMPKAANDDELGNFKKSLSKTHYLAITTAFERLWGTPDREEAAHIDGTAALTENCFIKNIKEIIGVDEPYFGKMLYLWMA